jgi:hypothetical protein
LVARRIRGIPDSGFAGGQISPGSDTFTAVGIRSLGRQGAAALAQRKTVSIK